MSETPPGDGHSPENTELYADLHRLAAREFRRQHKGHTLQTTALVNEAWLKLSARPVHGFESRSHFMAVAAKAMRHVLVDHARRIRAAKRGGDQQRVEIQTNMGQTDDERLPDVLDLDSALSKLALTAPRQAKVVELKFFSGLTLDEIAAILKVSDTIVSKEWKRARLWLARELGP